MSADLLVRAWQDEDLRHQLGIVDHPAGSIDQELDQVLLSSAPASQSITCTGAPYNCTRVASGGLCCC